MNAVLTYVTASDARISGRVRGWTPPRWVRLWMLCATTFGDGWLWLSVGLALLDGAGRWRRVVAAAAIAAGVANMALVILKRRFRRPRPCDEASHPAFSVRPSRYLRYAPSDRFSFPSGHSMNAFALGTVLALTFPWTAPCVGVVAASIAASRVVLGLHFVSDVLVGSVLGVVIGLLAYAAVLAPG
jgi:undecaprenyl-diphosphatase